MQQIQQSEATAAQRRIFFQLVDSGDGIAAETGVTGTGFLSKNGAAPVATSASLVELSATNMPGRYHLELTAAEVNTLGILVLRFKSAATAEMVAAAQIVPFDPYDATRMGLTALPNANAEATGGLYTRGTGVGQINQPANGVIDSNLVTWIGTAPSALNGGAVSSFLRNGAHGGTVTVLTLERLIAVSTTAGQPGILATGNTTAAGMLLTGGATSGAGLAATGGAPNGDGILATGTGSGNDFSGNLSGSVASVTGAVGSVTGAVGSVTGNVGGNVVGTVASVTGNVDGNVTGTVASVVGNVGGNVVGTVASVTGNVDGNVTGSVGSVLGAVASVTADVNIAMGQLTPGSPTADTTGEALRRAHQQLPERPLINTAFSDIEFSFVLTSDHVSAATGLTPSAERSLNGAAFVAATGTVTEVANGIYQFDASAADMNGASVTFRFFAATADDAFWSTFTAPAL